MLAVAHPSRIVAGVEAHERLDRLPWMCLAGPRGSRARVPRLEAAVELRWSARRDIMRRGL